MSVKYSLNPGIFGVSAAKIREELMEQGFFDSTDISVEGGELTASVGLTGYGETEQEAREKCLAAVNYLKARYGRNMFTETHGTLWETVVADYTEKGQTFALAESCTGGLISKMVTDVAGSSKAFKLGVVAYHPDAKKNILSVNPDTLDKHGIVSGETAAEMAEGVRRLGKSTVGIGVTGFAGPGGGDERYPEGTVFVALSDGNHVYVRMLSITNSDRGAVRRAATLYALDMLRLYSCGETEAIGVPMALYSAKEQPVRKKEPLIKRFCGFFTSFPKDPWGEKLRKLVMVTALGVMVFAGWKIGERGIETYDYNKTQQQIGNLINVGSGLTSSEKQEIIDILVDDGVIEAGQTLLDWAIGPIQKNPELVGQIKAGFDGEKYAVNQVVVQSKDDIENKRNEYYVKRSFFGNETNMGAVFMDYRCNSDGTSPNTILYGHSSSYESEVMFKPLHQYKNLDYLNEHPIINYSTLEQEGQYKVFAVLIVNTLDKQGERYTGCYTVNSIMANIDDIRARSLFDTSVDVREGDKLLTLSTCTYDHKLKELRLVIMARKVREGESTEVEPASNNSDAIFFKAWYEAAKTEPPTVSETESVGSVDSTSSIDSTSSTESETSSPGSEPAEGKFEVYRLALYCEAATADSVTSVKAYMPYMTEFDSRVTLAKVTQPKYGKADVSGSQQTVIYKPNADFSGVDSFEVSIEDGSGMRYATAEVEIYVGVQKQTGVSVNSIELNMSVKAGQSGTRQISATSASGAELSYFILPTVGLYSGSAEVDESGLVTYTSETEMRYADEIKVLVTDSDGYGQIVQINVNSGYGFETEQHPEVEVTVPSQTESR